MGGLTILPIRNKSIGECGVSCLANKKINDNQKKSILSYPQEHFLLPPSLTTPHEKIIQPIAISPLQRR